MTTATALPVLVAAVLMLWLPGWLYRQSLRQNHADAFDAWQARMGGSWVPSWRGWRLVGGRAAVRVVDGPFGPATWVDGAWVSDVVRPEAG